LRRPADPLLVGGALSLAALDLVPERCRTDGRDAVLHPLATNLRPLRQHLRREELPALSAQFADRRRPDDAVLPRDRRHGGFALSRLDIKGRFGILAAILSVSMFPQIAIVGPLYLLASDLALLDTYQGLVITYVALGVPLVTWVMFGYFDTLPREIDEAARMDGCSTVGLFWRIILPISVPSLVTTGLLAFIAAWNEFMFALAFTSNIDHQTVPVGIANFTNLHYIPWGDIAAASIVVTIPLVLLVLLFQRHIIDGLTQGAVKE
jgi:ABC-type glycerol-3-phosphate transport system permease component